MATIFPREEKAEMLFDKILANPEACRRLKRTFYDAIDSGDEFVTENLPAKQFTAALFDAYENKDLTAFLMAVCQNSMFDLLRNAFLIPFKFNADGQTNPIFLTDEEGKLLENLPIHVKEKCIWHMDIRKGIVMIQKQWKHRNIRWESMTEYF